MQTERIVVDRGRPDPRVIARCAERLRAGGLVAFPTETVYGLGALADDAEAAARIYLAKGRPSHNPLISHLPDVASVRALAPVWSDAAEALARRFWPGPLTLVIPRAPSIGRAVCGGLDAMAIRVPAHPVARALLEAVGRPIAAPSANRSNAISPTTAAHVLRGLDGRIDIVIDGGPCSVGLESTVVDLCGPAPVILRPGSVTREAIDAVVPGVLTRAESIAQGVPRASPGMDAKHYAPRATVRWLSREALRALAPGPGALTGAITVGPVDEIAHEIIARALPADPAGYGALLYEALHDLDARGCDVIACELLPEGTAWDAARDRIARASG
jgi:L-threonylcarbamoyladenylate synthase